MASFILSARWPRTLELKVWNVIKNINSGAVAIAFFGCYILPMVVIWLIFETARALIPSVIEAVALYVGLLGLWALILGPVCAGYMVARLSKSLPLLHGLIVSGVGSVLYVMLLTFAYGSGFWSLLVVPVLLLAGLFGAWFRRYRSRGTVEL